MVGWHHQLNGHESEQALEVGEEQGSLVCCSPLSHKESDTTELLNRLTETSELCDYFEKFSVTTGGMCADIMNTKQAKHL